MKLYVMKLMLCIFSKGKTFFPQMLLNIPMKTYVKVLKMSGKANCSHLARMFSVVFCILAPGIKILC